MAHGITMPHGIVAHGTGGRHMAHGTAMPHGIVAHGRMTHAVMQYARRGALGECRDREGRGKQSGGSESRDAFKHNWLLEMFRRNDCRVYSFIRMTRLRG